MRFSVKEEGGLFLVITAKKSNGKRMGFTFKTREEAHDKAVKLSIEWHLTEANKLIEKNKNVDFDHVRDFVEPLKNWVEVQHENQPDYDPYDPCTWA